MISRARIAITPKPLQDKIAMIREEYNKAMVDAMQLESEVAVCIKAQKMYPYLVRHPLGSRAIEVGVVLYSSWINLNCSVGPFSDAVPVMELLEKEGFLLWPGKGHDNIREMCRVFHFGPHINLKLFALDKLGSTCHKVYDGTSQVWGGEMKYRLEC